MPNKSNYCHLFVILAREASKGVIFRRGPRMWTEIILWDTKTDTFIEGQWFKGSLYKKRCDLSPDGSKMIYFAAKHYKGYVPNAKYPRTWTAISRVPYLTTLATAKGYGTYDGGGYFEDNNTIYINQVVYVPDEGNVPPVEVEKINVPQGVEFKPITPNGKFYDQDGLYSLLLEHRGWNTDSYENPVLWRKDNPSHAYSLFMTSMGGIGEGETWRLTLKHHQNQMEFKISSNEWADWDQQGRLVYTHEGKLFAGLIGEDRIEPIQLADFNTNEVRLRQSPPWAKTWDQF